MLDISFKGWWSRYSSRTLFVAIVVTCVALLFFFTDGIQRVDVALLGLIAAIVAGYAASRLDIKKYSGLPSGEQVPGSPVSGIIVAFVAVLLIVFGLMAVIGIFGVSISLVRAFLSGFLLSGWFSYLPLVAWEKKEKKQVIVGKGGLYIMDAEV